MSAAVFQRDVKIYLDRELSPQALSQKFATFAREDVAKLISTGRASPIYRRFVDGIEGVPAENVKPGGRIIYEFEYLAEIIVFALAFLEKRSPHATGAFAKSFYLGLDGKFVPMARFNPDTMGEVQEVVIGNVQPYARKVDVQMIGKKRMRFSVPAGLYDDCVQAIRGRFGNLVNAKRVYTMLFPGQWVLRGGRKAGKPVESPAIVISRR